MKKTVSLFLAGCAVLIIFMSTVFAMPEAKITVQIVDEDSVPMSDIDTGITFSRVKNKGFRGKSDLTGKFTASAETDGRASYGASKPGYYDSRGVYSFLRVEGNKWLPMSYKWLPWNPEVKVVLRKIGNPVPMYARDTTHSNLQIPVVGKEVGFDLMEYDWMPPYGKGKHVDFIFKLEKRYVSDEDFDSALAITFPNKFDGIQVVEEDRRNGSMLKLPRFAPEIGYQNKLIRYFRRSTGKAIEDSTMEDNNYIFRVRSEIADGKLVRAMYGKIYGDISVFPGHYKTAAIGFTYYLNPDYTRNLEYDRTRNLFGNLPPLERVEQ